MSESGPGRRSAARYQVADLQLDLVAGCLIGESGEVKLRPQTFRLFEVLVTHAPKIMSVDDLLDRGWGVEYVSVGAIRQAMSELRQALGDSALEPRIIETVHRRGYRLIAQVERLEPEQPISENRHEVVRDSVVQAAAQSDPGSCGSAAQQRRRAAVRWFRGAVYYGLWSLLLLSAALGQHSKAHVTPAVRDLLALTVEVRGSRHHSARPKALRRHGLVLHSQGVYLESAAQKGAVLEKFRQAQELFSQVDDRANQVGVLNRQAYFLLQGGEFADAQSSLEVALYLSRDSTSSGRRLITLCLLSQVAAATGRVADSRHLLEAARVLAPGSEDPRRHSLWLRTLADVHLAHGELEAAAEAYAECIRVATPILDTAAISNARFGLARVERRRRSFAAARQHIEEAITTFRQHGSLPAQLSARCELADIEIDSGRPEMAESVFRDIRAQAVELSLDALIVRAEAGLQRCKV